MQEGSWIAHTETFLVADTCCDESLEEYLRIYIYLFIAHLDEAIDSIRFLFLKVCVVTCSPIIESTISVPTVLVISALTVSAAVTPVAMLRKVGSSLKRFLSIRKDRSSLVSFRSLSILAGVDSL